MNIGGVTMCSMTAPQVYSVVEARTHLSSLIHRARSGETVYIGAQRKSEVVLISAQRLAELETVAAERDPK